MPRLRAATLTRPAMAVGGLDTTPPPAWAARGACTRPGMSPELFFTAPRERGQRRRDREATAKALCAGCPVRALCLAYAVDTGQRAGIWGGLTETERAALAGGER